MISSGHTNWPRRRPARKWNVSTTKCCPIGFKAETDSYNWGGGGPGANRQYWLILLVITIIYFCCAVLFESLTEPLIILSLIPISFIGVFLTFGITGYTFDRAVSPLSYCCAEPS